MCPYFVFMKQNWSLVCFIMWAGSSQKIVLSLLGIMRTCTFSPDHFLERGLCPFSLTLKKIVFVMVKSCLNFFFGFTKTNSAVILLQN